MSTHKEKAHIIYKTMQAMVEENRPIETLWDAVTGITAFAKTIEHQDDRVAIERVAGKVLQLAA